MWYAEKIELIKNIREEWDNEEYDYSTIEVDGKTIPFKTGGSGLGSYYTVKINGETISNHHSEGYELCTKYNYQSSICVCGCEGCNSGGYLLIRRHEKSIFILPAFDVLDSVAEFNIKDIEDMNPPDKWYVDGILEIKEPFISELKELGLLFFDEIPEMSEQELNMLLEWETLVKNNGFTNIIIGYCMFLDDIREVDMIYPETKERFYYARSYKEFIKILTGGTLPKFISFDTDLGVGENNKPLPDGLAAAEWLVYVSGFDLTNLKFNVHSGNPFDKLRIESLLNNHIKFSSEKV